MLASMFFMVFYLGYQIALLESLEQSNVYK
jgi:hypothetical protein